MDNNISIEKEFFVWLSEKSSLSRLTRFFSLFLCIDDFCIRKNILKTSLFKTTDIDTIKKVIDIVDTDKEFRFIYKGNLSEMSAGLRFYYKFIKEKFLVEKNMTTKNIYPNIVVQSESLDIKNNSKSAMEENLYTNIEDKFYAWLSSQISDKRMTEICPCYPQIEKFFMERGLLKRKLFETHDIVTIKNIMQMTEANKVFRFTYKGNVGKMNAAMRFYYNYLKENPQTIMNIIESSDTSCFKEDKEITDKSLIEEQEKIEVLNNPSNNEKNECILNFTDTSSLHFSKPIKFYYFGKKVIVSSWTQLYVELVRLLLVDYSDILYKYINSCLTGKGRVDFSDESNKDFMTNPKKVNDNFYLETNLSAPRIVFKIKALLDICNIDYKNLEIVYCEKNTLSNDNSENDVKEKFSKWMKDTGYKSSTILSVLSALKQCSDAANIYNIYAGNIMNIDNVKELIEIRTKLFSKIFGEEKKRQYKNGFDKLIEFVSSKDCAANSKISSSTNSEDNYSFSIKSKISKETQDKYTNILKKYFNEDGYQLGRSIFRARFRRNYSAEYGDEPLEKDEEIDRILSYVGTQRDGRIFPKQDEEQNSLVDNIINDVVSTFESGVSAIYIEAIYNKYAEELTNFLHIYNIEALSILLLENSKGRYYQKFSFLVGRNKDNDSVKDLIDVMKNFHEPKTYEEIHKIAWFIPYNKMKVLLANEKSIVNVAEGSYFYAPNLPISESDINHIVNIINCALDSSNYITETDLIEIIKNDCPDILINTEGFTTYGLRNCLSYILRDKFSFNGPIISRVGSNVCISDVFLNFVRTHEKLSFSEIKDLSTEINSPIYWDDILKEMIRVSQDEFISKSRIIFDINAIDSILDEMCINEYMPLKDITLFLYFPNIGYKWNEYVLESYLYNYSRKFKLIHMSFGQNSVSGAIVRSDSEIVDYHALIVDVLSKSDALTSKSEALQYIVQQGYQKRQSYKRIEEAMKEAKLKKEQINKNEK